MGSIVGWTISWSPWGGPTLGTAGVSTLGAGAAGCMFCGMVGSVGTGAGCTRFNVVASSSRAARTGSPAVNVGTVVLGGCSRIWMISSAACLR